MKHRYIVLTLGLILTGLVFSVSSCRKINEATELGGDLIPAVDNINTFDTTITVEAYNGIFDLPNDSLRLSRNEEHWLGKITNDPIFGGTDAKLYFELKPPFYKYFFITDKTHMVIDSVVLILDYIETYGDTNALQTVNVYEIDPNNTTFKRDSAYLIRVDPNIQTAGLLGSRTFAPSILNDSVKAFQDSLGKNQMRIRLDNSFGTRLLNYDSTAAIGPNAAYVSDSLFRTNFKGFALESTSGNAVMGFDLNGEATSLAIYYRYDKAPITDTPAVAYFHFTDLSASANYITRTHSATILAAAGGVTPDDLVYIQTEPGTFATIKIPALAGMGNRLVHRAELIMEQAYNGVTDSIFNAPTYLYLDASDPTITTNPKFRTIPYDLLFDQSGGLNIAQFGMAPQRGVDPGLNPINIWKFNLTRYVQHILNGTEPLYDLRLFAPFFYQENYRVPGSTTDVRPLLIINPAIVKGRIRLAGGTPASNPQRMRMRIIYSKL